MELIKLKIPSSFVTDRTCLSWRDVCFGLENELLDPQAAIDLAAARLAAFEYPLSILIDLASADRNEPTRAIVEQLAEAEPPYPADEIRDKWLFIVLAWVYEHRSRYGDPLQILEEVYSDFGYPAQMTGFVRYMPMELPDLGSRAANEQRLVENWRRYLDEAGATYAPHRVIG